MKTYTFTVVPAQGPRTETVVAARNMRVAVAKFQNSKREAAMTVFVKKTGSHTSYPVTRERWGGAFDGEV